MSTRDHQQIPDQLSPWPSLNTVDYFYNPHYGIRFVILTWSQIILEEVHMGYSKAQKEKTHKRIVALCACSAEEKCGSDLPAHAGQPRAQPGGCARSQPTCRTDRVPRDGDCQD